MIRSNVENRNEYYIRRMKAKIAGKSEKKNWISYIFVLQYFIIVELFLKRPSINLFIVLENMCAKTQNLLFLLFIFPKRVINLYCALLYDHNSREVNLTFFRIASS